MNAADAARFQEVIDHCRSLHVNQRNGYAAGQCHCDQCVEVMDRLAEVLLPVMHNPDHDAPFRAFAHAMASELRANSGKGDRAAWLRDRPRDLLAEIQHHYVKLHAVTVELDRDLGGVFTARPLPWGDTDALASYDRETRRKELKSLVREFAADVANMAMMLADNVSAL